MLVIISASMLFGLGVYYIICEILRLPSLKARKAFVNLSKRQKKKTKLFELIKEGISLKLSKLFKLNEYKRLQMAADLQSAGMEITPELHISKAIVKAIPVFLLSISALFIFPLVVPLILVLVFMIYYREVQGVREKIKNRRDLINYELPRLVYTIEKTLKHNRDVLTILDEYKSRAGSELKDELTVTIADMRSGNYESALTRFEARVGSYMLSDVVRGLIGVLRGDETDLYWSALSVKFSDIQRQMLKKQALKVPNKVKRLSMCLLMCFMLMYVVVICVEVVKSLGIIF